MPLRLVSYKISGGNKRSVGEHSVIRKGFVGKSAQNSDLKPEGTNTMK